MLTSFDRKQYAAERAAITTSATDPAALQVRGSKLVRQIIAAES